MLSAVRDAHRSAAEAVAQLSRSPRWGGTALDPATTWLRRVQGGHCTRAMAPAVVPPLAQLLAPGGMPRFLSDGSPSSLSAIVTHCGHWGQPPRCQARGPVPKPRGMPLPARLDAQVVKDREETAPGGGQTWGGLGTPAAVANVLAVGGWQTRTAFVARLNLSLRQRVAASGRRSATPCKSKGGLGHPLGLCQG